MIHFTKKDPAAVELGRKGGLSPEKRTEIAKPSSKQARNIYELLKQTGPSPPLQVCTAK